MLFTHGKTKSKGVAIAIDKKLNYNINNTYTDDMGRLIIVDICIDDVVYMIVNVYFPTKKP